MKRTDHGAVLLRIFLAEGDRGEGRPLHEALVLKARQMGLAGATVVRGPLGFGVTSRLHTTKILQLAADLPMIVEIVDERAKIDAFLDRAGPLLKGGLVTLEEVRVVRFDPGSQDASAPA